MTDRSILVTGAAGKTGRAVLRGLTARGGAARALVRRPEQRRALERQADCQAMEGDLQTGDGLAAAVRGVETIYHICPNVHPEEVAIARRLIDAAVAADVARLVFHSVLHPQIAAMPHHWRKMRVEELIFESGLDFTILQPAPYMQNVLGQWQAIRRHGIYRVPYGLGTRLSMVDLTDVGEAAARVLTEAGHGGATYELCAPDLLDPGGIAAALGQALGREVHASVVGLDEWAQGARAGGLDDERISTLRAMFEYYDGFGMTGGWRVLEGLLGRPPTDFDGFLRRLTG